MSGMLRRLGGSVAPRTLLIVRHAKSDWEAGAPDHERPLNARGRREAPELGRGSRRPVCGPTW